MKVCILASGSKGNCAYIETDKTRSLVDLGMSASYISKSLKNIGDLLLIHIVIMWLVLKFL